MDHLQNFFKNLSSDLIADELPSSHRSKEVLEKIYGKGLRKPGIIYKTVIDEANSLIEKETKKTGKGPLEI